MRTTTAPSALLSKLSRKYARKARELAEQSDDNTNLERLFHAVVLEWLNGMNQNLDNGRDAQV